MMFMDRQAIIAKLRENEAALKARGVSHAALFGSRTRGDSRRKRHRHLRRDRTTFPMDVFHYVGVVHAIEDLFAERVDFSNRAAMKAHVRPNAEREAVYAF